MKRSGLHFTWDSAKDRDNQIKHGISFDEARTVFLDENAKLINDPDHSDDEDRFVLLGMSAQFRILIVCHCYRDDENEIRLISARKATKTENKVYKGNSNAQRI